MSKIILDKEKDISITGQCREIRKYLFTYLFTKYLFTYST